MMKRMVKTLEVLIAMVFVLAIAAPAFAITGDVSGFLHIRSVAGDNMDGRDFSANPGVLPSHANAFGKSYGEWSAEWWKWTFSLPVDQHPLSDTADCSEGQSGKVWFLGGTYTTLEEDGVVTGTADRECTVPVGKALFFPIVNAAADSTDDPDATEKDLREWANDAADHMQDLEVVIDGTPVEHLGLFRAESPLFMLGPLPDNNVLGQEEGSTFDAVADGFYCLLAPLSKGAHEIHFGGKIIFTQENDGFDFTFILDITYHINVENNNKR